MLGTYLIDIKFIPGDEGGDGGKRGEMPQTLYAHINQRKK
jgi:hypothetical protein